MVGWVSGAWVEQTGLTAQGSQVGSSATPDAMEQEDMLPTESASVSRSTAPKS